MLSVLSGELSPRITSQLWRLVFINSTRISSQVKTTIDKPKQKVNQESDCVIIKL